MGTRCGCGGRKTSKAVRCSRCNQKLVAKLHAKSNGSKGKADWIFMKDNAHLLRGVKLEGKVDGEGDE
ncbi:hypothetical protein LCGC14_3051380 [marine sediment metagenome]|uniref:Uncharacterized protein n=1 Tax=marine sediment metagenome TaxID=412755 RepID=A0A0F8ZCG8_9ZZZZ